MSAGTKVSIATVVLLGSVLAVYYGFRGRDGGAPAAARERQPADEEHADAASIERPTPTGADDAVGEDPRPPEGVLSQSVADAIGGHKTTPDETRTGVLATDWVDPNRRRVTATGDLRSATGGVDDREAVGPGPRAAGEPGAGQPSISMSGGPATALPAEPSGGAPPRFIQHTVEPDDTMWTIAEQWYGDASRWAQIARANPLIDPNRLRVGQRLRIPAPGSPRPPLAARAAQAPDGGAGIVYTVQAGDTLTKIARAYYSDTGRWGIIFAANRATIGQDPDRLKVGMKLKIPAGAVAAERE
ncbi:MAG: LysM peptidoglycan-binding domain-containing protein [Planctomycetota bacterium]|jgi:nucleoid-associated protein YgaU